MKEKVLQFFDDLKRYWNVPREGESTTNKQFLYFCLAGMFILLFNFQGISEVGWFGHDIMGIRPDDLAAIGLIGMVVGYIFIWASPFEMLIFENFGVLGKREKILMHVNCLSSMALAIFFYASFFLGWIDLQDSTINIPFIVGFDGIMQAFPLLLANILLMRGVHGYLNWLIRRLFTKRFGRVKPMIIACSLPAVIFFTVFPWIPGLTDLEYHARLAIMNGAFLLMGWFAHNFSHIHGMLPFISQHSTERQRYISFTPVLFGLFITLGNVIHPVFVTGSFFGRTFTGPTDIYVYRLITPIFSMIALLGAFFLLKVKENIFEQKVDRPKVKFFRGAKNAFKNKYFWIQNASDLLGLFQGMWGNLMGWWFLFQLRDHRFSGIAMEATVIGWTIGHFFVLPLIKRFEKRNVFLITRVAAFGLFFLQLPVFLLMQGSPLTVLILVALLLVSNILQTIHGDIRGGFGPDMMDYHQWKTGERADAVAGVFGWIFNPLRTTIGLLGPMIWLLVGWTGRMDVLWNSQIFTNVMTYGFWYTAIGAGLSIVPFIFYDLTSKKHKNLVEVIKRRTRRGDMINIERLKLAGKLDTVDVEYLDKYSVSPCGMLWIEKIEQYEAQGKLAEIDAEILARYGYDLDGRLMRQKIRTMRKAGKIHEMNTDLLFRYGYGYGGVPMKKRIARLKEAGKLKEISPRILKKFGYDLQGNMIEDVIKRERQKRYDGVDKIKEEIAEVREYVITLRQELAEISEIERLKAKKQVNDLAEDKLTRNNYDSQGEFMIEKIQRLQEEFKGKKKIKEPQGKAVSFAQAVNIPTSVLAKYGYSPKGSIKELGVWSEYEPILKYINEVRGVL